MLANRRINLSIKKNVHLTPNDKNLSFKQYTIMKDFDSMPSLSEFLMSVAIFVMSLGLIFLTSLL